MFGLSFVFSSDRLPFWLLASVCVCLVFLRFCASFWSYFVFVLYSPTTNCPFDFWLSICIFCLCLSLVFSNDKLPFWLLTRLFLAQIWQHSGWSFAHGNIPLVLVFVSLNFCFSVCIWTCIFVLTIADSALLTWLFQSRIHSRGPVSCRKYSTFHCSQPPFLLWSLFSSLFLFFCVLFYGTLRSCLVITHLMFCQTKRCYSLHFSKLLHVFVKAVPHICMNCYMHLSK